MNLINSGKRIMEITKKTINEFDGKKCMEIVLIEIIHCLKH